MEWSEIAYEKIKKPFLDACVSLKITPNQLTIFNHVLTLTVGCWAFSRGTYLCGLLGLLIMIINGLLDYLDGDLAEKTCSKSKLGAWLDSGFDVIIQNAVLGAISIGCFKMGMPLFWVVLFFIANAGNNLVSFRYNEDFGFSSTSGNELFRQMMDSKKNWFNVIIKNLIDPTSSFIGLTLLTFRYFIVLGMCFGIMPYMFIAVTIIANIKWAIMFAIYALHQSGAKFLHVLLAISVLDKERREYYALRSGEKI